MKRFALEAHGTDVRTELLAGLTTFLTMAYIVVVNPDILSVAGMDKGALLTVTCLAAGLSSIGMGLLTNYPFALAPGMGLNAFFAFTVVKQMGISWQMALTAVFVEGLLFVALTLGRLREALVKAIPLSMKHAVAAGIGLFITLIGLKNAGLVVAHPATLVGLGDLHSSAAVTSLLGLLLTGGLIARETPGALLLGMFGTAALSWSLGHAPVPTGVLGVPPSPAPLFLALDWGALAPARLFDLVPVIFAFFFVDFFDTLGTLVGVSAKAGLLDREGHLPKAREAFLVDAFGTTGGALLGTSTVTTYIESAAGVKAGGRTGLTAVSAGVFFLLAPFLAPLLLAVPPHATAPVLIVVGLHMMEAVREIDFEDFGDGLPAFLTIVMMPFTFSISEGIVFGVLAYTGIRLMTGRGREVPGLLHALSLVFLARMIWKG